jgi:hypothetical protein
MIGAAPAARAAEQFGKYASSDTSRSRNGARSIGASEAGDTGFVSGAVVSEAIGDGEAGVSGFSTTRTGGETGAGAESTLHRPSTNAIPATHANDARFCCSRFTATCPLPDISRPSISDSCQQLLRASSALGFQTAVRSHVLDLFLIDPLAHSAANGPQPQPRITASPRTPAAR